MSDLISRQAAIDMFQNLAYDDWNQGAGTTWANAFAESADMIEELPSAEVTLCYLDSPCEYQNADIAMPSAQQWIPVSEGLPEEHESIWAKAKGTDRWSESMWEKQSDEVIVTELFEDGTTRTGTACTHDGEWYVKAKIVKRKIVAWMPLPKPWRGEEDDSM